MRFGPVPLEEAAGKILAHNVTDGEGRRVLRKGRTLDADDVATLRELGRDPVYVAELGSDDVHEDLAAARIARVLVGPGAEAGNPHTGRVNVHAQALGVLRVDAKALTEVNRAPGVAVATLTDRTVVDAGARVATVKIIPYGVPADALEHVAAERERPVLRVDPIAPQEVGVVLVGSRGARSDLEATLGPALARRMKAFDCTTASPVFADPTEEAVADALARATGAGVGLLLVAGETAIMDVTDLIPRGIVSAGGRIEHLGLPMDPGQLLLLGYLGPTPVVGAPGCVRGRSPDGFDAIVSRLLAGERLSREDLQEMGHGGLFSNPRRR